MMLNTILGFLGLKGRIAADGIDLAKLASASSATVYPIGDFDQGSSTSPHVPLIILRFNDILDPTKLRDSLEQLLQTGHWRKLAGRFVRDKKTGKVQIVHVPELAPLEFSQVNFDISIEDHPLGKHLPSARDDLLLQPGVQHFYDFCAAPGTRAPTGLDDYLRTGRPPISLRVTTFEDATLVAVSGPHALLDGLAAKSVLTAWCLILAGRADQVPDVSSPFNDVLDPLLKPDINPKAAEGIPQESYVWADKTLTGWRFIWFVLRFLWTTTIVQPRVTSRTLVLPPSFVAQLRQNAPPPPGIDFISDSDIISAWFTRLISSAHGWDTPATNRPLTLLTTVDIRGRLPWLPGRGGVYLQNLTTPIFTMLQSAETRSRGLGDLAAQMRQSIAQQMTPSQIHAIWDLMRPSLLKWGVPPIFAEGPDMNLMVVSSWVRAKLLLETDFSPAVVRPGRKTDHKRTNLPGRPVYELSGQTLQKGVIRDVMVIVGKDSDGYYWLGLYVAEKIVDALEKCIRDVELTR
jgi:hypothetical protein